jgi:hypothetical protein
LCVDAAENEARANAAGAVEILGDVMSAHMADVGVLDACAAAIRSLAYHTGSLCLRGVPTVTATAHSRVVRVPGCCCGVAPDVSDGKVSDAVAEAIVQTLDEHPGSETLVETCAGCVRNLSLHGEQSTPPDDEATGTAE